MNTSKFLAGALVGLIAGLLIAPEKGEDLREDIAESAENLKKKLYKLASKAGNELGDLRDMLSKEVDGLGDDVRQRMLTILDETAERSNGMRKKIANEIHS